MESPPAYKLIFFSLLIIVAFFYFNQDLSAGITGATIASGGNITELNLSANATSLHWAGIYGMITVNTSLPTNNTVTISAGTTRMANVTIPCYSDKLYASLPSLIDWDNLLAAPTALVDSYLNLSAEHGESATMMFIQYRLFNIRGILPLNLSTTYTLALTSGDSPFDLGIINNSGGHVLATHLVHNQTGFDGQNYDYQMLLPIPAPSTTYRLFADCGACTTASTAFSFKPMYFSEMINITVNNSYLEFSNTSSASGFNNGTITSSFTGMQPLTFSNSTHTFLEFDFDFGSCQQRSTMENLIFEKRNSSSTRGSFLVRGITLPAGHTKTFYLEDLNETSNSICIKDSEITDIIEISSNCSAADETRILCTAAGASTKGYTCTDEGKMFKVTGANHSGAVEISDAAEEEEEEAPPAAAPGSGGGWKKCPPRMILSKEECILVSPEVPPPTAFVEDFSCAPGHQRIGGVCLKPLLPTEEGLLFKLTISLPPEKQKVPLGEKDLPLNVKLVKLNDQWIPTDFLMYYLIHDLHGKLVVEDTGEVTVLAESSFIQHLNISSLHRGNYTISAYAIHQNTYDDDSTGFMIVKVKKNLAGAAWSFAREKGTAPRHKFNWLVIILLITFLTRGFCWDLFAVREKK